MQTTHKLIRIVAVFCLLTLVARSASAQSLKAQFDEWGNGSSGGISLSYYIAPSPFAIDPISGFSTLTYQLPWPVARGDLIITDSSGNVSDLIRFDTNTANMGVAYFFSDVADEFPVPLADNLFGIPPPNAAAPSYTMAESGVEGNDYVNYLASGNLPGAALPGPTTVAYTIISDSPVPEPSTFVLLGISAIGLLAYYWRKRK